jgi:hypothetical protein
MVRPIFFILPVRRKIIALTSEEPDPPVFENVAVQKLAVQGRYKVNLFLCVLTGSLQGVAERRC